MSRTNGQKCTSVAEAARNGHHNGHPVPASPRHPVIHLPWQIGGPRLWHVSMTIEVPRTIPARLKRRIDQVERRIDRVEVGAKDVKRLKDVLTALERLADAVGRPKPTRIRGDAGTSRKAGRR